MVDLKALTAAVGDLDEDQVVSVLEQFVATKPSEEEA